MTAKTRFILIAAVVLVALVIAVWVTWAIWNINQGIYVEDCIGPCQ